jgi:hypothetical protein
MTTRRAAAARTADAGTGTVLARGVLAGRRRLAGAAALFGGLQGLAAQPDLAVPGLGLRLITRVT